MTITADVKQASFIAAGTGPAWGPMAGTRHASQATRTGSTGTSTIVIEATNTPNVATSWVTLSTLSPTSTGAEGSASAQGECAYLHIRARPTAVPAGSTVTVSVVKQ
jgi:hypothetical protein